MYILTMAKLDAVSHCWVANLANYNFQLYCRAGKINIDADALLRMSWPGCIPDTSGTHHQVTAAAVQAIEGAILEGPVSPAEVYSCDLHVLDPVEDSLQVACLTTDDWCLAQWAEPSWGLWLWGCRTEPWARAHLNWLIHPSSCSSFKNATTSSFVPGGFISIGLASCTLGDYSERVPQSGQSLRPQKNALPDAELFHLALNGYTGEGTYQEVLPVHHLQGEATEGPHGEYHGHPSPGANAHQLLVPRAREGRGRKHPGSNRPLNSLHPDVCHSIPDGPDNGQGPLWQFHHLLHVTRENPFGPVEEFWEWVHSQPL